MRLRTASTSFCRKRRRAKVIAALLFIGCVHPVFAGKSITQTEENPFHRNGTAPPADAAQDFSRAERRTLSALQMPLEQIHVNSPFGWRHKASHQKHARQRFHYGVDYGAPRGTPVHATYDGTIDSIGRKRGFGYYIRLLHDNGVETAYAHMARFAEGLRQGDEVSEGDVIGYVGTTGRATGPHLHYEVLVNGTPIDPETLNGGERVVMLQAGRRFNSVLP